MLFLNVNSNFPNYCFIKKLLTTYFGVITSIFCIFATYKPVRLNTKKRSESNYYYRKFKNHH